MKQRPPATDLSGPKASADSLTPQRNNLAVADAVDFQLEEFFSVEPGAFSLALRTGWTRSGTAELSVLSEEWSEAVSEAMCCLHTLGYPTGGWEWVELVHILPVNIAPLIGRTFYRTLDIQPQMGTPLARFHSFEGGIPPSPIVLGFAGGHKPGIV